MHGALLANLNGQHPQQVRGRFDGGVIHGQDLGLTESDSTRHSSFEENDSVPISPETRPPSESVVAGIPDGPGDGLREVSVPGGGGVRTDPYLYQELRVTEVSQPPGGAGWEVHFHDGEGESSPDQVKRPEGLAPPGVQHLTYGMVWCRRGVEDAREPSGEIEPPPPRRIGNEGG